MLTRSLAGHVTLALTTGLFYRPVAARYHMVISPLVPHPRRACCLSRARSGLAALASTGPVWPGAEWPMTDELLLTVRCATVSLDEVERIVI